MQLIKDVLRENGYYQPTITVQEFPDSSTQQVELRFQMEPGAPAKVGDVIIREIPATLPRRFRTSPIFIQGTR